MSTATCTPPRVRALRLFLVLACALAPACGDDGDPPGVGLRYPDGSPDSARPDAAPADVPHDSRDGGDAADGGDGGSAARMVGPAGGMVTTPAGVTIAVPAGAVSKDTLITVTPTAVSLPESAGPSFLFGPEGQEFSAPVAVTLPFDPATLPPGEEPVIYTAPAGATAFEAIGGVVIDATHVQALTTHFSVFVAGRKKGPPKLASLELAPQSPMIGKSTTVQLTATAIMSDQSKRDVTAMATFTSSNAAVATVSATGLATGVAAGTAMVTATFEGKSASTTLTVRPATLEQVMVTPTNPAIAAGTTLAFAATGIYSDNSTQALTAEVTWASSTPAVASIVTTGASKGTATALLPGATTITATFDGKSGSTSLTVTAAPLVSVMVTPSEASIAKGTVASFTATGTYGDNSTQDLTGQVTWTSSNSGVATMSAGSPGQASGVGVGFATITASVSGLSGSAVLTVTAATLESIMVTPVNPSIAKGTSQQLAATGTYSDGSTQDLTASATWASSSAAVSVSNAAGTHGQATGADVGSATVSASLGSKSGSTTLTVTAATLVTLSLAPQSPSIAKGTTAAIEVTGIYSDGSSQSLTGSATWASSNPAVATVSNAAGSKGVVTSLTVGTANITAAIGGRSASTTLTVTAATLVSVAVTPANPSIANGTRQAFIATGVYTDNTTQNLTASATWASSNTAVATISNAAETRGEGLAVGVGTASISATVGGRTGATTLTVTAATLQSITVIPGTASIANGTRQAFIATGLYTDSTTQDLTAAVTWASTNTAVASVSNAGDTRGEATGVGVGATFISASLSGKTGSASLTVTAATLVSISVTPGTASIANGTKQSFMAAGLFTDGTTQNLTTTATWTVSNDAVATISNATDSKGEATGAMVGSTTVTASSGGKTGSATLTVTAATLVSITIAPAPASIAVGAHQAFTATGHYSDGSTQPITDTVVWGSSDTAIAVLDNADNKGRATAVSAGSCTVTATQGAIVGMAMLTVTPPAT